jgi:hypothetical protein
MGWYQFFNCACKTVFWTVYKQRRRISPPVPAARMKDSSALPEVVFSFQFSHSRQIGAPVAVRNRSRSPLGEL